MERLQQKLLNKWKNTQPSVGNLFFIIIFWAVLAMIFVLFADDVSEPIWIGIGCFIILLHVFHFFGKQKEMERTALKIEAETWYEHFYPIVYPTKQSIANYYDMNRPGYSRWVDKSEIEARLSMYSSYEGNGIPKMDEGMKMAFKACGIDPAQVRKEIAEDEAESRNL